MPLAPVLRVLAPVLLLVALAGLMVPASSTAYADGTRPSAAARRQQSALAAVNEARSHGRMCGNRWYRAVGPVRLNPALNTAASRWSSAMASQDFFSHERGRSTPARRIDAAGYRWRTYGENIAAGFRSAGAAVDAFLDSPGHCANIMTPFREMGIGFSAAAGSTYGTYWTMDLATR